MGLAGAGKCHLLWLRPTLPHPLSLTICGYGDPDLWDSRAFSSLLFLLSTHCQRAGCQDKQQRESSSPLVSLLVARTVLGAWNMTTNTLLSLGPQEEADKNAGRDETMD